VNGKQTIQMVANGSLRFVLNTSCRKLEIMLSYFENNEERRGMRKIEMEKAREVLMPGPNDNNPTPKTGVNGMT